MSVLAGPCPTQKSSKGLRRTRAKPALLEALPTGTSSVQQSGCKLKAALKSPLPDDTEYTERLGDDKSFIRGCSEVLTLGWCFTVSRERGKEPPACGKQPGGLWGILARSTPRN